MSCKCPLHAIQKLNCKANYKTPFFHNVFITIILKSNLKNVFASLGNGCCLRTLIYMRTKYQFYERMFDFPKNNLIKQTNFHDWFSYM